MSKCDFNKAALQLAASGNTNQSAVSCDVIHTEKCALKNVFYLY